LNAWNVFAVKMSVVGDEQIGSCAGRRGKLDYIRSFQSAVTADSCITFCDRGI